MILSGGSDGLVAVSSPTTGMTVRMINDHQGAPITCFDVTLLQVLILNLSFLIQLHLIEKVKYDKNHHQHHQSFIACPAAIKIQIFALVACHLYITTHRYRPASKPWQSASTISHMFSYSCLCGVTF